MATRQLTASGALLLAIATLMSACAASGPIKLTPRAGQEATEFEKVPVALRPEDRDRVDDIELITGTVRPNALATGAIWSSIFVGNSEPSQPVFQVKSARLIQSASGMGFMFKATYQVVGELKLNDKTFTISTEASRSHAIDADAAMYGAVKAAAVEAGRRAHSLIPR